MRKIVFVLLLCATSCNPKYEIEGAAIGQYDKAVSVAVNNFVRHEKRLLSKSDVFDVSIDPDGNLLVVSSEANDNVHNNYLVFVGPKDTTINPVFFVDEENLIWTWILPSSDTILVVKQTDNEKYAVTYSPENVLFDFSRVPNRMLKSAGRLFVWRDGSCDESQEVINTLIDYECVDYCVIGVSPGWFVINDGEETICYDLEALNQGRIRKHHDYGLFGNGFRGRVRQLWFMFWHPQNEEQSNSVAKQVFENLK